MNRRFDAATNGDSQVRLSCLAQRCGALAAARFVSARFCAHACGFNRFSHDCLAQGPSGPAFFYAFRHDINAREAHMMTGSEIGRAVMAADLGEAAAVIRELLQQTESGNALAPDTIEAAERSLRNLDLYATRLLPDTVNAAHV
ncbi:MAG: hypothetical protein HY943_09415 [Gammaproteobacteria bacterium]|nr:hypothetical protein [Gammaproteobacteria bacterium]